MTGLENRQRGLHHNHHKVIDQLKKQSMRARCQSLLAGHIMYRVITCLKQAPWTPEHFVKYVLIMNTCTCSPNNNLIHNSLISLLCCVLVFLFFCVFVFMCFRLSVFSSFCVFVFLCFRLSVFLSICPSSPFVVHLSSFQFLGIRLKAFWVLIFVFSYFCLTVFLS